MFRNRLLFKLICILVCLALSHPSVVWADQRQEWGVELDIIKSCFKTKYVPFEWKQLHAGWDLEKDIAAAKLKVNSEECCSIKEFQSIVKEILKGPLDYHVKPHFYATERAELPFCVRSANKRYFFSYIEKDSSLFLEPFPFEVGDELLTVDGVAVDILVQNLSRQGFNLETAARDGKLMQEIELESLCNGVGHSQMAKDHPIANDSGSRDCVKLPSRAAVSRFNKPTDQMIAEVTFTLRFAELGDEVPQGVVTLVGMKKGKKEQVSCKVEWGYVPEYIFSNKKYDAVFAKGSSVIDDPMIMIGSKRGCLPFLGEPFWQAPKDYTFFAYLFHLDNKVIGVVRISTFGFESAGVAVEEFAEIIEKFQKEADCIVIDQMNNSGGCLLSMYALLSMLTDKPLQVPKHHVMIGDDEVYLAYKKILGLEDIGSDDEAIKALGKEIDGYPISFALIKSIQERMQEILQEAKSFNRISSPGYMYGISSIMPHPKVQLRKPVLCLINPIDMSCADFFPAILQDNKRATLMGERTAGAGGAVSRITFPNGSGIRHIEMTTSMAVRPCGTIIENCGVSPDIEYIPTVDDLQDNYVEYKTEILNILREM